MPYDEKNAERLRAALADLPLDSWEHITERKMFGGLCFLLNGSILVGVGKTDFLIRLSEADVNEALALSEVRRMHNNGRVMKNFAFIATEALADEEALDDWLEKGLCYVREWQKSDAGKVQRERM